LQLSTHVPVRTLEDLVAARFTDSHAFTQSPGSPDSYELPFGKQSAYFPVALDLQRQSPTIP